MTERIAYTIVEACAFAGVRRTSLYKAIGAGELRAIKCGGRTLVLPEDLHRWLEGMPAIAPHRGPTPETASGPSVIVHDGSGSLPPQDG
jgi:excisionase family DNA binding protein